LLSCPASGRPPHLEGEAADPLWRPRTKLGGTLRKREPDQRGMLPN